MRALGGDDVAPVVEAIARGRCVLCLGGELTADGSLRRLIGKLLDAVPDAGEARALLERRPLMAADYVRRRLGDGFAAELARVAAGAGVPEPLALLSALPFAAVLTTSYDPAVERAFARGGAPAPVLTPRDVAVLGGRARGRVVFKLLGDPARPETVVWGAADLQEALGAGGYRDIVDELFRTRSFLFLGFDWADAELGLLLERILSTAGRGEHFAVLSNLQPLEREELAAIYGIRVLDGVDAAELARTLHAAVVQARRPLPADDDVDGLMTLLADDPSRADVIERLDAIEARYKREGNGVELVSLYVGRTAVEHDHRRRAALLVDAARVLEDELHDATRALTARLAAYRDLPTPAEWEPLERLAAASGRWRDLEAALVAELALLPASDRADAWARIGAIRDEELGDVDGALAATEAALALEPDHKGAIDVRLAALRRAGRWQELSLALGRAVLAEPAGPRKAELYTTLGRLFDGELGDPAQAAACYRLAIEADPWAGEARDLLEALYERRGEIGELIASIEARAERAPPTEQAALRRRIAALCAERLGDRALALRHLEALRAAAPGDLETLRALERLYEQEGRTRELLDVLADAAARSESERDRIELLRRLAAGWEKLPDGASKAADALEQLLTLAPRDGDALETLARIYHGAARLHELAEVIERQLAIAPPEAHVRLYLRLASTREALGQVERAHAFYAEALRLDPSRDDAFDAMLRLDEGAQAWDHVVGACVERAAAVAPAERPALFARAATVAGERLGDAPQAEALFARALELDPRHVSSLLGLAQLYRRQGELRRAARLLSEAVDHAQNRLLRTRLLVEAAELHERSDDPAAAVELYKKALELDPEHVDAAERAGELLWRAGRFGELVGVLQPLAAKEAPPPVAIARLTRLGTAHRALGDVEAARRDFGRALALDGSDREALRGLGDLAFDAGRWADAQACYEKLVAAHGASLGPEVEVELHHRLGVCHRALGRHDAARAEFALATAIDPLHRPSRLGQLELGDQDPATVIEAKKALLPTAGRDEQLRLYLEIGDLYLDRFEDPVQAVGAWEAGLRVAPDDVRLLHRCLGVFLEQKAWTQAMGVLERLIRDQPKPATRAKYHYTAGIICLEHLGRFADAADHLWASVEGDPGYKRAATALEEMLRNHKSWKELVRWYQFALQKLEPVDSDEKRAEQTRMWAALGELYLDKLRDVDSAIVALEVARRLDPTAKRRQRLATVCTMAGGRHLPLAIAEHRALVREDKARIASYRALKELCAETGRGDEAAACAIALSCLKPDEEEAPAAPPLMDPTRPLPPETLARLRHPDESADLTALFALVAPSVAATRAQRDRAPLGKRRLVAANDPRPFARAVVRAATAFGLGAPAVELADHGTVGIVCAAEGQKVTPVLQLGGRLVDDRRGDVELAFDVARAVWLLRPEQLIRLLLPLPHELGHLVAAAMALADEATGGVAAGELAKTTQALKSGLGATLLDQVTAIGHRLRERGTRADAAALRWLQTSDLGSNRAALVVAGDVRRSAQLVKDEPPPQHALPAPQRILDLVWSSTTEELVAARRQLVG